MKTHLIPDWNSINGSLKEGPHSLKTVKYIHTNSVFKLSFLKRVIEKRQPVGYPSKAMCNRARFLPLNPCVTAHDAVKVKPRFQGGSEVYYKFQERKNIHPKSCRHEAEPPNIDVTHARPQKWKVYNPGYLGHWSSGDATVNSRNWAWGCKVCCFPTCC